MQTLFSQSNPKQVPLIFQTMYILGKFNPRVLFTYNEIMEILKQLSNVQKVILIILLPLVKTRVAFLCQKLISGSKTEIQFETLNLFFGGKCLKSIKSIVSLRKFISWEDILLI